MDGVLEENRENFYDSMKLDKYGFGLKTTGFVSFLAWTGIMTGILCFLFSVELLVLPTDIINFPNTQTEPEFNLFFYIGGIFGIFFSIIWFSLHLALRRANVEKDFQAIRKLLKIKSYITGGLEIIFSILGIAATTVALVVLDSMGREMAPVLLLNGILFIICLALSSCKVHGVRKNKNNLINAYIFFKITVGVSGAMAMAFLLVQNISGTACVLFILGLLVSSFFFIYHIGDLVVLFNFNHHLNSKMYYNANLEFTNQAFMDENVKMEA